MVSVGASDNPLTGTAQVQLRSGRLERGHTVQLRSGRVEPPDTFWLDVSNSLRDTLGGFSELQ